MTLTGIGTGLLDRLGYLYECDDYGHCDLATEIVDEKKYKSSQYTWALDILLYSKGFIHLGQAAGIFTRTGNKPSQAQIDALWDISQATTSEYFRYEVLEYIGRWQGQD